MIVTGTCIIIFRKKELTINLSVLIITLFILSTGAEIFFRTFSPQAEGESDNFFSYDSVLGWQLTPLKTGYFASRHEFKTKITINSRGMRDREYALAKEKNKKRIVVLGDSFTSGFGVPDNATFTKVMETILENHTEVLNFGVNGYGPTQELLTLQTKAIKYSPDLVIMVIYIGNDFYDILGISDWIDGYVRPKAVIDNQGKLRITNIPVPLPKNNPATEKTKNVCKLPASHFSEFIDKYIHRNKYAINSMPPEIAFCKRKKDPDIQKASRLMEAVVSETNTYCRQHRASFMIAIAPTIVQVYDQMYWGKIINDYHLKIDEYDLYLPNRILIDIFSRIGIPAIDLTEALKSSIDKGNDTYYFYNQHWNKAGEQVVAETIARFIKDKKLL
jgi:lysophospholipase L1-like esterase